MVYVNVKVSINIKTQPKNFCTISREERIVKQQGNESVKKTKLWRKRFVREWRDACIKRKMG